MAGKWTGSNPATNMNTAAGTDINDLNESDTEEQLAADENTESIAANTDNNHFEHSATMEQLAADGNNVSRSTQQHAAHVYNLGGSVHVRPLYEDMPGQTSNKEPLQETQARSQQGAENTYADADESRFDAMTEHYRLLSARIVSFRPSPLHSPLRDMKEQLAKAGFYYTGNRDSCACFACGGKIKSWKPGDDPWIRHCQMYPNCPFLNQEKDKDFINLVVQNSPGQESDDAISKDTYELTVVGKTEHIVHKYRDILTLDMGFSDEQVRCAVRDFVEQGHDDVQIDDIVERIEMKMDIAVENEATSASTENIEAENIRLRQIVMCCDCTTREKEVMFLPCCHAILCVRCSRDRVRCPKCGKRHRGQKENIHKVVNKTSPCVFRIEQNVDVCRNREHDFNVCRSRQQ